MATSDTHAGSGIPGVDAILRGGFARGKTFLIRGTSGAGKTTLSLQFLAEGARLGEKSLYYSTSETEEEIRKIAANHGWSLDGVVIHHHDLSRTGTEQTMLHSTEVELPQTTDAILSVVNAVRPDRMVIDSLSEIRVLAQDELWYRRQLLRLKEHFDGIDCTLLLVEVRNQAQDALNSIVTGVVELEQTPKSYGADRRRLRVVKVRGQDFSTGYHDFNIRTGGLEVFPRLIAADSRSPSSQERVSTGLSSLDEMLSGGLTRGTSTLLIGPSGTGKSALATQMVVAAAKRGERSAMFIFDERVQTLLMRASGLGMPLEEYISDGTIVVRQVDPAELTSGEFSHMVRRMVDQDQIQTVVIDSLNGYSYAMPEEKMLGVHLHELSSYLNQASVTSLFTTTQHGMLHGGAEQPFDVSYIADTVIVFVHFEFRGEVHKAVAVYKNRTGLHETSIRRLALSSRGLEIHEPLGRFRGILTGAPTFEGEDLNVNRPTDKSSGG